MLVEQAKLFEDGRLMSTDEASTPEQSKRNTPVQSDDHFAVSLLALGALRGVGVATLRHIIEYYGNPSRIWSDDANEVFRVLTEAHAKDVHKLVRIIKDQTGEILDLAQEQLEKLTAKDMKVIAADQDEFPERLANVPGAPYWLFVEGELSSLNAPLIGIVGTREPTSIGKQTAAKLTALVVGEGFGIVSGLAEGIDDTAHRVAYGYSAPQVAVLGTGIDIAPFPASTAKTRYRLLRSGGAVITEYLPGQTYYDKSRFVERNRIQAALALAIAPVESKAKSGTAHTLNFSESFNRPVFGVYRTKPAPENEMVQVLYDRGYPTFDLDKEAERERLFRWLGSLLSPGEYLTPRRQIDKQHVFQPLLQQFDYLLSYLSFSPEDVAWLQEQLNARFYLMPTPTIEEPENGG